jgi:hypothetical protein
MKRLNLMLHCGAEPVEYDQLDVPLPPQTETFVPIPHSTVLNTVKSALTTTTAEWEIVQEKHGMTHDGDRYFGLLQLTNPTTDPESDTGLVVGVRNSHDHRFAASLALGHGVFVCDNLAFSGEVRVNRRHTRHIRRDFPGYVARAVGKLLLGRERQQQMIDAYKNARLGPQRAHDIVIQLLDNRVIGSTMIPKILEGFRRPTYDYGHRQSAWNLFNAVTEQYRQRSPAYTLQRTQGLHGTFNRALELSI